MKDFARFSYDLRVRESSNIYTKINSYGYLGAYQFGRPRLWDLGLSIDGWKPEWAKDDKIEKYGKQYISAEEFCHSPSIQDTIFKLHVEDHLRTIDRKFKDHIGSVVNGIVVTESGMVAGLHLKGIGTDKYPGLRQFLEGGVDGSDGYDTKISEYVSNFGGYDLSSYFIKAT